MGINVLVVDDSAVMRTMILKTMAISGLPMGRTYQAGDGRQGLDILANHPVDLVIVDINMPVMNGEEMIDAMRERSDIKDVPIVIISTEGSQTRIERLKQKGAVFVHKPFPPEIIRDTVKSLLGLSGGGGGSDGGDLVDVSGGGGVDVNGGGGVDVNGGGGVTPPYLGGRGDKDN